MRSVLFYFPHEIGGVPILSSDERPWGLLLILWAIVAVGMLSWHIWRRGLSGRIVEDVLLLLVFGGLIRYVLPNIGDAQGLPVRGYGVMLLIAVLASVGLLVYRGKRLGLDSDTTIMLAFWLIVPGIIGA